MFEIHNVREEWGVIFPAASGAVAVVIKKLCAATVLYILASVRTPGWCGNPRNSSDVLCRRRA